mmetsp:Transcript_7340/g.18269  ORF Transcript_7340/g.18269 Transcript_7340/m.18269 type:complete len:87 (+) Transcript_7340:1094-1354(+)
MRGAISLQTPALSGEEADNRSYVLRTRLDLETGSSMTESGGKLQELQNSNWPDMSHSCSTRLHLWSESKLSCTCMHSLPPASVITR